MHPKHYTLHLEPDLNTFTCPGRVTIAIETATPVADVTLNALDLDITTCTLTQGVQTAACTFATDAAQQTLTVVLPQPVNGDFALTFTFIAQINDQLVGLYRSQYIHNGAEKYLAVTQFEEREARRAFPCFDHPAKKATFDIEFLIDAAHTAIANTAITSETPQPGGKKLVRFDRTPKMSTYLLFFGSGDFEIVDDGQPAPLVRVATTPGKTQYGAFALDWGRKSLDFGADYTGIPFPISKCDYIAVPDFAFGAMENYGAITFRENALLVYPGVTSQQQKVQIASVIAHETAHMWFGDLVSPAEWKDIWLNESFATYFTYAIPHHFRPEWQVWDDFFANATLRGMERDALRGTVPIELPAGEEVYIDASSAPIIYSKGAAIIRMLATYLGDDKLKQGINHFLDEYSFQNATSSDYWQAFEAATGVPVSDFATSWIAQPGYPLVTAQREGDPTQPSRLHLSQERFTVTGDHTDQTWTIPLTLAIYLADGTQQTRAATLDTTTATLTLPAGTVAYKLNAEQTGFFRAKYAPADRAALSELIRTRTLSAVDSCGIASDLYALTKRGDLTIRAYLDFIKATFANEDRYLPLLELSRNLLELHLVARSQRERISAVGRDIFERALLAMHLTPQPDDDLHTASLRNRLLWAAFTLGSEEAATFGENQFQAVLAGETVPADILENVYRIGAVTHGAAATAFFHQTLADADAPEVQKLTALTALGSSRDKHALRAALDHNFSDIPKKNRVYMTGAVATNPAATDFLWDWTHNHLDDLQTMHPAHFGRILVTALPLCPPEHRPAVTAFITDLAAAHPAQRPILAMVEELLEIYARLREFPGS